MAEASELVSVELAGVIDELFPEGVSPPAGESVGVGPLPGGGGELSAGFDGSEPAGGGGLSAGFDGSEPAGGGGLSAGFAGSEPPD